MDEITELRQQMAEMKRSLDKYNIVNQNLIKTVMKKRTQGLNWIVNAEFILLPFISLFYLGLCAALDMSMWFAITCSVACLVSALVDIKTMKVSKNLINRLTLKELRIYLLKQKRSRKLQLAIEMPLMIVWLIWFLIAFFDNKKMFGDLVDSEIFMWIKIGIIAVTFIITLVVIMVLFSKSQKINDAIINDIDTIQDTSESVDE